nr:hypothetical protein [Tanacetum cinerariifolium]
MVANPLYSLRDKDLFKLQDPQVVVAAAKLPIRNPNKFDQWKIRIEQYFLMTNYSLWEVILNGDSPTPTRIVDGVVQVIAPTTAEQRLAKKNELKLKGTLLMALPDKHQLKFNIYKDAKSLMEAIKKRLQKLISQLQILLESISQEDINLKFLRSLPSEWKTHTLIWRNKANLEEQSLDDLFNNLKIYKVEVKSSYPTSYNTQNIAFVSSNNTDSPNKSVSAVPSVSATSSKASVSTLLNVDNISGAMIYSFFARGFFKGLEGIWVKMEPLLLGLTCLRNTDTPRIIVPVEASTSNDLVSQCNGVGSYDWSFQADKEPINYALVAFTSLGSSSSLGFDTKVFDYDDMNSSKSDDSVPTTLVHDRYTSGEGYHDVPPPYTETFMPLKPDLVFSDAPNASKIVPDVVNVESSSTQPSKDLPVTTVVPKSAMKSPRPVKHVVNKEHTPIRRHINHRPAPRYRQSITTLKDKCVIDSGCSRHMTGNISYLSNFKEINEGYVAFGRNPKGGKITGKVTEFKVEALQVNYHLIDWEIHSEGSRTYWKIIRVGGITQAYQSFEDILKYFNREDLDVLWRLVKNKFSSAVPTVNKEKALWVEIKRLFEPDADDMIWKLQRYMHYLII